jgi:hypothetical protein
MKVPGPNLDDEAADEYAIEIGPPLLLTLRQAAALCQVSLDKMQGWSHIKGFPVIRGSHFVRVHAQLLNRWLAARALEDGDEYGLLPTRVKENTHKP